MRIKKWSRIQKLMFLKAYVFALLIDAIAQLTKTQVVYKINKLCWCHQIPKSKTKEPGKFLSSSGIMEPQFISVNIFFSSIAYLVWKPAQFIVQSSGGAWHTALIANIWSLWTLQRLEKFLFLPISYNITISWLYPLNSSQYIFSLGDSENHLSKQCYCDKKHDSGIWHYIQGWHMKRDPRIWPLHA